MAIPLTLQMEIDISAAAHKREIAEEFAKLRAKYGPTARDIHLTARADKSRQMHEALRNAVMSAEWWSGKQHQSAMNSPAGDWYANASALYAPQQRNVGMLDSLVGPYL